MDKKKIKISEDMDTCTVCNKELERDEMFKCSCCGERCCNNCCATEDVSICMNCSGESEE